MQFSLKLHQKNSLQTWIKYIFFDSWTYFRHESTIEIVPTNPKLGQSWKKQKGKERVGVRFKNFQNFKHFSDLDQWSFQGSQFIAWSQFIWLYLSYRYKKLIWSWPVNFWNHLAFCLGPSKLWPWTYTVCNSHLLSQKSVSWT